MKYPDTEANLEHAKSLTPSEIRSIEFYTGWLPDRIVDAHAHSGEESTSQNAKVPQKNLRHMSSTYLHFPIERSRQFDSLFHPGKKITRIRFAKVQRGLSQSATNQYLLSRYSKSDRMAAFGMKEDLEGTIRVLSDPRCCALKMYYLYCEPTAETILDTFPPELLEACQDLEKPIILHLPKPLLKSFDDLISVLRNFPTLKVSLAHLGLHMVDDARLDEAFKKLVPFDNVNLDTALNISKEVFARALKAMGPCRIMYGTDEPINLLRFNVFRHPEKGERIVSDRLYHWADHEEHATYSQKFSDFRHSHWLALDAARHAIETVPNAQGTEATKELIFEQNAVSFFGLS